MCVVLGYHAFRIMMASDADLRLKLGKDFTKSRWDILPGAVLVAVGLVVMAIAYLRPPST